MTLIRGQPWLIGLKNELSPVVLQIFMVHPAHFIFTWDAGLLLACRGPRIKVITSIHCSELISWEKQCAISPLRCHWATAGGGGHSKTVYFKKAPVRWWRDIWKVWCKCGISVCWLWCKCGISVCFVHYIFSIAPHGAAADILGHMCHLCTVCVDIYSH